MSHGYTGRSAVLATMHGKEQAVAPVFGRQLGLSLVVPEALDTDLLGTFSGEIARFGNMEETAIAKARAGMRELGLPIGIASEGSYGPHPQIPFIPAGLELMVFVDDARRIIIREHLLDESPVYAHTIVASADELGPFLDGIGFPGHGVIAQPHRPDGTMSVIHKGLRDYAAVAAAVEACRAASGDGRAQITTDMRAHVNPTRMKTLRRLAEKLAERILAPCPACAAPGFGMVERRPGLPCSWCGEPTRLTQRLIFGCVSCRYREDRPGPGAGDHADPGQCARCNP